MESLKPIKLYGHEKGPNPQKVVIILEELEIPYEASTVQFEDVKKEPFVAVNPNGRLPAIEDPNTGIALWESGAIVEYLVETYDRQRRISSDSFPDKFHMKKYLHFQMSGQGPYYGQWIWFELRHPEKIEHAIKRYEEQTFRVVEVLDKILKDREYLVGDRASYADLVWLPWERIVQEFHPQLADRFNQYKNYKAWYDRLMARPAVQKALGV
ncbi:glutathione S-transferase [Xylariomycetidae sp. FL2044]|nr:glutathione S-transferase [Xylariomycetidae sp. FL2044]